MKAHEFILSLPKSLWVSFRLCSFREALRLPVRCRYNVSCRSLKGRVLLDEGSVMYFGFGDVGIFDRHYSRSILQVDGTIHLDGTGRYRFGHGSRLCVGGGAHVYIGAGFMNPAEMTLVCMREIRMGRRVAVSWNTLIMDTDFHPVKNVLTGALSEVSRPVVIGDRCWLGARSVVLKGGKIAAGCIVGAGSVVTGAFREENSLIAGSPARVRKQNVTKGD